MIRMPRILIGLLGVLAWNGQVFATTNPWTYDPANVAITGGTIAGANASTAKITPTGGNTARANADVAADVVNVKSLGATGNGRIFFDNVVISGSSLITTANDFTAADVGKTIIIQNAGVPPSSGVMTSIPIVSAGSGYGSVPSCTVSGGSGDATCTSLMTLQSATLVSGGASCTNASNQQFIVTGGTGTPAIVSGTVSGGVLTGPLTVVSAGQLVSLPATISGANIYGGGCQTAPTVNLSYGVGAAQVTAWGTAYPTSLSSVTVTLSGGSPTAAATLGTPVISAPLPPFITTISTYNNATSVTLTAAPGNSPIGSIRMMVATDDSAAIQSAIALALSTGKALYAPGGLYWVGATLDPGAGPLSVIGDGMYSTIFMWDGGSGTTYNGTNWTPLWEDVGGSPAALRDRISFQDIQFRGTLDFGRVNLGASAIELNNYKAVRENKIRIYEAPNMAQQNESIRDVSVSDSEFDTDMHDMVRFRSTLGCTIVTGNHFIHSDDDAIALHQSSSIQGPGIIQECTVVANNTLEDTSGIHIMNGRNVSVHGNVLRREKVFGIAFGISSDEGVNPLFNVDIFDNVITDFVTRAPLIGNGGQSAISVVGQTPALPVNDTTTVPVSNQQFSGYIPRFWDYRNSNANTDLTGIPPMAGVDIHDNIYARTLPAALNYSAWGYGMTLTPVGFLDPPVTDAALRTYTAIGVPSNINGLSIHNNMLSDAAYGINLGETALYSATTSFDISDNNIFDTTSGGIVLPENASANMSSARISGNSIDVDPYLLSSRRSGAVGAWASGAGGPYCIQGGSSTGPVLMLVGNTLSDCEQVTDSTTYGGYGNIAKGQAASMTGWNAANYGIGIPPQIGGAFSWISIENNSSVAPSLYKSLLYSHVFESSLMPTTGSFVAGEFVAATSAGVVNCSCSGWTRLTTGSGNVGGTDWKVRPIQ